MSIKKVLITGAGGLMGGYVIDKLIGHYDLHGIDILPDKKGLPHTQDTILNYEAVQGACEGMDAVVQIAAVPNIWSGSHEEIIHTNVTGTWNVLKAAEEAGVKRVIVTSSDSVIGYTVLSGSMIPPDYLPIDETHICRPTDPYALSKKLCEELTKSFVDRASFEAVIMRPVFVLYPDLEPEVVARAADPEGYSGPVCGGHKPPGGGAMWHYIDPRDLATAYKNALDLENPGLGPYFLSGPNTLAPDHTLNRLSKMSDKKVEIKAPMIYKKNPFAPLYALSFSEINLNIRAHNQLREKLSLYDGT